jgi:hypothetical protein
MKHIKLFLEGFQKSDYYKKLDALPYNQLYNNLVRKYKTAPFTDEEREFFQKECNVIGFRGWMSSSDGPAKSWDQVVITIPPHTTMGNLKICKLGTPPTYGGDEEWWYVERGHDYYMCDGWEGVLEFLKDNGVIR